MTPYFTFYGNRDIMNDRRGHRAVSKKSVFFLLFTLGVWFLLNVMGFFTPDDNQPNFFYRFDEYKPLETWNLPYSIEADFDGDGLPDRLSFFGCLTLSRRDPDLIPTEKACTDMGNRGSIVFDRDRLVRRRIIHSYLARRSGENWQIVINRNGKTVMYDLLPDGTAATEPVPIALNFDSAFYIVTHSFVYLIGM